LEAGASEIVGLREEFWVAITTKDMKNKRRIYSAECKARVALDSIKGIKTVQEIAAFRCTRLG